MMMAETGAGTPGSRSAGGTGCRAIWQCTHSIGSVAVNGRAAGEHLVERDAQRIEVAAGIDRAVHPPGLFGGHVGERAGDDLGRLGRLALARQARGDAEPGQPDRAARPIHQDMGRLDVLVDEPPLMQPGDRRDQTEREAQEAAPPPSAGRAAAPAARRPGPPAPAWSDRVRGRAPAAAPPTLRPAHPSVRIREQGDRGWPVAGAPRRAARPARRRRWPSARRRHPRQNTRSPSSHKTWRLSSSSPPNGKNRSNCRTPSASRLSPSVKQAGASARIRHQQPGSALCQSRGTMTMAFSRHQATVG